jgi:hypothetical protein
MSADRYLPRNQEELQQSEKGETINEGSNWKTFQYDTN